MLSQKEVETIRRLLCYAAKTPFFQFNVINGQLVSSNFSYRRVFNLILFGCHVIQFLALVILISKIVATRNAVSVIITVVIILAMLGTILLKLTFFLHTPEYVSLMEMMLKFDDIQGKITFINSNDGQINCWKFRTGQ